MVLQRWCIFKVALKSFTVLHVSLYFRTLRTVHRALCQQNPLHGPATATLLLNPPINKPHCLWEVVIVGPCSETRENSRARLRWGVQSKESKGWGGGWGKMKSRNSSHSPLVFSRFLRRQLLGCVSEVSNQRGNWSDRREEENHILEGTRHLHTE